MATIQKQKDTIAKGRLRFLLDRVNRLVTTLENNNFIPEITSSDYDKLRSAVNEFKQKHLESKTSN
jgi:hypothetical protein